MPRRRQKRKLSPSERQLNRQRAAAGLGGMAEAIAAADLPSAVKALAEGLQDGLGVDDAMNAHELAEGLIFFILRTVAGGVENLIPDDDLG